MTGDLEAEPGGGRHALDGAENAVEGGHAGDAAGFGHGLQGPLRMLQHEPAGILHPLAGHITGQVLAAAIQLDQPPHPVLFNAQQLAQSFPVQRGVQEQLLLIHQAIQALKQRKIRILGGR